MSYEKKIICLANSIKNNGRCVAGKELINSGYGSWIRPVSYRKTEEISEEEQRFENGKEPQIMDIVSIRFTKPKPDVLQPENHLIDSHVRWKKHGEKEYKDMTHLKDAPDKLWINGNSSSKGCNDRFADNHLSLSASLYLIYLETLQVKVITDFKGKRQERAIFQYNQEEYNLAVTDPKVKLYFEKKQTGVYDYNHVYLCVSIGIKFEEYHYKLVASIIKNPMF